MGVAAANSVVREACSELLLGVCALTFSEAFSVFALFLAHNQIRLDDVRLHASEIEPP